MVYGGDAALPVSFLDDIGAHGIVLAIHRRNMPRPVYFLPHSQSDDNDILTKQIIARENLTKRCYVARSIIASRLNSFKWLISIPSPAHAALRKARSLAEIRAVEAEFTKRYWDAFYARIGLDISRRESAPVNAALDAGSKFLSGILLRWVLFHKLSPTHGFMHEPTTYISLVYDLIESYRVWIEQATAAAYKPDIAEGAMVAAAISNLKEMLLEEIHLPAFQKQTRRKNLLHAQVLALRSYLAGETPRFVIPTEGTKIGGRPVKTAFNIPGAM